MKDILDTIYQTRVSFIAAGLNLPAAIVLASHEDGMRFLASINQSNLIYTAPSPYCKPIEHPDGSIWMEATFAGIKIHWPANRIAMRAGGFVYG